MQIWNFGHLVDICLELPIYFLSIFLHLNAIVPFIELIKIQMICFTIKF